MAFSKAELLDLYRRRAPRYDITANLYYLLGFREQAYRRKTVAALNLKPGDTVVEIGCGTGLNFSLIQDRIGPAGRLIGVDLTPEMLKQAKQRVAKRGWTNVDLIQSGASQYRFPSRTNAILSTFAITLVPGGRLAILDFRVPAWPDWLIRLFLRVTQPFGVTLDLGDRHPWKSVERHLSAVKGEELFFGVTYLAVGEKLRTPFKASEGRGEEREDKI